MRIKQKDPKGNTLLKGISYRDERFRIDLVVNGKLVTRVRKTLELALKEQKIMEVDYPNFTSSKVRKLNSSYRLCLTIRTTNGKSKVIQKDIYHLNKAISELHRLRKHYQLGDLCDAS